MEYTKIGVSDMPVSRLCLGCMSFGANDTNFLDWTLDYEESEKIMKHAFGPGINFFDTANCYSSGTSEEYVGRAIKKNFPRSDIFLATKVFFNADLSRGGLSKEAVNREIDNSLKRLGTDYVDLYIIHRFDRATPVEETMEALHGLVRAGKVLNLGASAMYGYQFHNMQAAAENNGWTKFAVMQNHYNLLYREDEREMIPICEQYGTARTSYSPLASGRLSRRAWHTDTKRSQTDRAAEKKYDAFESHDCNIVARVYEVAERHGATMTQVALAWQFAKNVASPIIGVSKLSHLDDAADAFKLYLPDEEIRYLESAYIPHKVVGAL